MFTRLGRIAGALNYCNKTLGNDTFTSGLYGTLNALQLAVDNIHAQYATGVDAPLAAGLFPARESQRSAQGAWRSYLQSLAQATVISMVNDDIPQPVLSLSTALPVLITQMGSSTSTIQSPTVSASAAAYTVPQANHGNGVLALSVLDPLNGLQRDYLFPETITFTCTQDSQGTPSILNAEPFSVVAPAVQPDELSYLYPQGSGANLTINAADAATTAQNFLANGGFLQMSPANTPVSWVAAGSVTIGTNILQSSSTAAFVSGATCLEIVGDSTTTASTPYFTQVVGLTPETAYAVIVWLKADVVPSGGVFKVQLTDGTGTVVNDQNAVANTLSVTLSGVTTSYVAHTAFFRTPRVLPSVTQIRVGLTTTMTSGSNLFVAGVAVVLAKPLYQGGPLAALFSGNSAFIVGDGFNATIANNNGGALQLACEQLLGMRALGLQIASSASPSISDSLVS